MPARKHLKTRSSRLAIALGALPVLPMAIPALASFGIASAAKPDAAMMQTLAQAVARGENLTTVEQLRASILAKRGDFRLIDLRAPSAFAVAHIQGAINIPLPKLLEPSEIVALRRSPSVIVYSETTNEAAQGVVLLRLSGVTAVALQGGLAAWSRTVATDSVPKTAAIVRALNDCPEPAPAIIPALGSITPASATTPQVAPAINSATPAKPKVKKPINLNAMCG